MKPDDLYPIGVKALFPAIQKQLDRMQVLDFIGRFNQRDVSLWSEDPLQQQEIAIRLDWLDAAENSQPLVREVQALLEDLLAEGYSHAVILGMGGSSLAPEVYSLFAQNFGLNNPQSLNLSILDSTSPEQILEKTGELPLEKTLFIVSSKSGTTVEVNTLFSYFWEKASKFDPVNTGRHFIAIGDPDTRIQKLAAEKKFRKVIAANPNVGGRYSALIAFGLLPAILAGYDGARLLRQSLKYTNRALSKGSTMISLEDEGVKLGVIMAAGYAAGRDKLTLLADPETAPLGSWIEQLIAESSGKDGNGILPVDQEARLPLEQYGPDRLFVYLRKNGGLDDFTDELLSAGHPVTICRIEDVYDLAAEFYRWEIATAVACALMGVNAFDQPNVQESKDIAKRMLALLKENQDLGVGDPLCRDEKAALFGEGKAGGTLAERLDDFLQLGQAGDYLAINAFISRGRENEAKLQALRDYLGERTGLPVTLGFGPRFLHSTGQLHKGGKNNGLFIVISQDEAEKIEIPGEGITFNDLLTAQSLGDTQALRQHHRRVMRLHFANGKFGSVDLKSLFKNKLNN